MVATFVGLTVAVSLQGTWVDAAAVPEPGDLLVVNELTVNADGTCDGWLRATYNPLPVDYAHRVRLVPQADCSVIPEWGCVEPKAENTLVTVGVKQVRVSHEVRELGGQPGSFYVYEDAILLGTWDIASAVTCSYPTLLMKDSWHDPNYHSYNNSYETLIPPCTSRLEGQFGSHQYSISLILYGEVSGDGQHRCGGWDVVQEAEEPFVCFVLGESVSASHLASVVNDPNQNFAAVAPGASVVFPIDH